MDEMEVGSSSLPEKQASPDRVNPVLAGLASAIIPGTGQLLRGKLHLGLIFLGLFAIAILCLCPGRLATSYLGYGAIALALFALTFVASCMAILTSNPRRWRFAWLIILLPVAVVAVSLWINGFVRLGGLRPYLLASSSMEKTILKGDRIMTDERAYRSHMPERGDVITFNHKGTCLSKRLIGLPGDRISINNGVATVNGKQLDEPYAVFDSDLETRFNKMPPKVVPAGQVYLLGDNRNASLDSRMPEFGEVSVSDVTGKVLYILSSQHGNDGRPVK